ncbi:hypothetical protein MPQ_1133 [Methylovorus sp. MP688]|nr:hypothetical protein MPQ_1133 [Methylovorus sp. MP688]
MVCACPRFFLTSQLVNCLYAVKAIIHRSQLFGIKKIFIAFNMEPY